MFPVFVLHSVHLPSFKVFKFFLILLFSTQCVTIISWVFFFFHLNVAIGSFLKIYLKFLFMCKTFPFFLIILIIFGRNQLYVIMKGIMFDFSCVSFPIIRSILLSRFILQDVHWLMMDDTFVLRSRLSFLWDYDLNLIDMNLFAPFRWLSMVLGVQILYEGSAIDQLLFCISLYVIYCYVDIFQCLETQCNLLKLCKQIL